MQPLTTILGRFKLDCRHMHLGVTSMTSNFKSCAFHGIQVAS